MKLISVGGPTKFPMGAFLVGTFNTLTVKVVTTVTTGGSGLSPHLVLLLGMNVYNNFAAFSAFSLRATRLLGSNDATVTVLCTIYDIIIYITTTFLPRTIVGWRNVGGTRSTGGDILQLPVILGGTVKDFIFV